MPKHVWVLRSKDLWNPELWIFKERPKLKDIMPLLSEPPSGYCFTLRKKQKGVWEVHMHIDWFGTEIMYDLTRHKFTLHK